ncbi:MULTISPECIES: helix-turn-helix domain-containing protein [Pseudobacillus]|uniref:helix-turn-helix domain-containing protein n=1 Tax=Pseudobacillus TaxID=108525 RepID=UPI00387A4FC8
MSVYQPKGYTIEEAATILNKSKSTIYKYIKEGKLTLLTYWEKRGMRLLSKKDVENLAKEQKDEKLGWTTAETAQFLGLSRSTIQHFIHEGQLPAIKGKMQGKDAYYIKEEDVRIFGKKHERYIRREYIKRRPFYDREHNIALYQRFSSPSINEARLIWDKKKKWQFMILPTREILSFHEGIYRHLLTPDYALTYGEQIGHPGLATATLPLDHPLTFQWIDIIYQQSDLANIYFEFDAVSPTMLTIKLKNTVFENVSLQLSSFLKERIEEGRIEVTGKQVLIESGMDLMTIQLPSKLKEKIRQKAEKEKTNMQKVVLNILDEHLID